MRAACDSASTGLCPNCQRLVTAVRTCPRPPSAMQLLQFGDISVARRSRTGPILII